MRLHTQCCDAYANPDCPHEDVTKAREALRTFLQAWEEESAPSRDLLNRMESLEGKLAASETRELNLSLELSRVAQARDYWREQVEGGLP